MLGPDLSGFHSGLICGRERRGPKVITGRKQRSILFHSHKELYITVQSTIKLG